MEKKINSSFIEGWWILYRARTVFASLIIIAVFTNIFLFIVSKYGRLVSLSSEIKSPVVASPTSSAPALPPRSVQEGAAENEWSGVFRAIFNVTSVIVIVSLVFIVLSSLLGILMIIAARAPGAAELTSAFFWSIATVAIVLPWRILLPYIIGFPAIIVDFDRFIWDIARSGSLDTAIQWLKYVAWPLIVVLFIAAYLRKTSQASLRIMTSSEKRSEDSE